MHSSSERHLEEALVEVLADSQRRGAIGPGAIVDHIEHALAYGVALPSLETAERVLDLGSGGGLPGLVLAARYPATRFVLLDGRVERAFALSEQVQRLGLGDRVEVIGERAETAAHRPELRAQFAVVVARSFGRPAVTAECGGAFVRRDGALVVSDPPGSDASRWPDEQLRELGLVVASRIDTPRSFVVLRQDGTYPDRYPRSVGVPTKRPLF